jgi:hypothetical protein
MQQLNVCTVAVRLDGDRVLFCFGADLEEFSVATS